nr:ImmA/IrrE family metallo-endopeptidase [uncultured Anaerocolumna sp.]
MDIEKLIKKYKTRSPIEIADNLGIIVTYEELGTINGYYNTAFRQKFIHINKSLPKHRQQLTAAHELGHALLHPNSNTPFMKEHTYLSVDKLEIEANTFAVNLLISDEDLEEYKDFTTEQLSILFGYHEKLIELRLKSSRLVQYGSRY